VHNFNIGENLRNADTMVQMPFSYRYIVQFQIFLSAFQVAF